MSRSPRTPRPALPSHSRSRAHSIYSILALATAFSIGLTGCDSRTPAQPRDTADVIFFGSVLTLVEDESEAEALAIKGDRILAVGSRDEIEHHRGGSTKVVDLGRGALLPGFIDAHGHLSQVAAFVDFANVASPPVGPIENIAQLQEALRAQAAETADEAGRDWIIGRSYDESLLAEGRHPTRDDLDAVSTERPVFIVHVSLHLGVANSRALELAGIDASTPNPKAGVIRRRTGSQEPNGVLEEHAAYAVFGVLPKPTHSQSMASLQKALTEYSENGFTTLQDGAISLEDWAVLDAADRAGALHQDVIAYPTWMVGDAFLDQTAETRKDLKRVSFGGIKFVLDGSPQGKTAYLTEPYHVPPDGQGPDYRGYPAFTDDELTRDIEKYTRQGIQIMAHANGDAAVDQLIMALDAAESRVPAATGEVEGRANDRRPILIHGQATRRDQLPDLHRLGVVPSLFAPHTFFWGDWHRDSVFGPERGAAISPTASALKAGLPLTIHMDAPVLPPDSMRMIWATANRLTRSGALLGGDERISVMAAIAATTRTAAYQYFLEAEKGTLEVGKLADLVVLDQNPREVGPDAIADIEIRETWSHGERIY
jgi:predicted amidohydrolase YtcJ